MTYSSLHTHSASSLDGIGTVPQWVEACKNKKLGGLALTEHGNCASMLELYHEGKRQNLPILMGCEFYLVPELCDKEGNKAKDYYHITVLVKNFEGYKNICRLSTLSFHEDHKYYRYRITFDELFNHHNGLIIASGCLRGPLCHEILKDNDKLAEDYLKEFHRIWGDDYYIELQPSIVVEEGSIENKQEVVNRQLIEWADRYQ